MLHKKESVNDDVMMISLNHWIHIQQMFTVFYTYTTSTTKTLLILR
jgi:hypothetical protein